MDEQLKQKIQKLINSNPILLFMKGTPEQPRCGFSLRVVDVLQELGVKFKSFDILTDETIRQGVKEFANWPTYPQLWVKGKLIGGCDLVVEMYQNGTLTEVLQDKKTKK